MLTDGHPIQKHVSTHYLLAPVWGAISVPSAMGHWEAWETA